MPTGPSTAASSGATLTDREVVRRVLRYLRPHRGSLAVAVLAFLLASATEPLIPGLLQKALDDGFTRSDAFPLWMVPVALIGLFALRGVLAFAGQYMLHRGISRSMLDLRRDLSHALLHVEGSLYSEVPAGVVVNRLVGDPQALAVHGGGALITLLRDGTTALALVIYLFWLNWQLTALAFVVLPLLMWGARQVQSRMRRMGQAHYDAQTRLAAMSEDLARSWRVIRTFDAQSFEGARINRAAAEVQRTGMKAAAAAASMTPISQLVASLGVALIVTVAMYQVRIGQGTVGGFVGYIGALLLLVSRARHLTDVSQSLLAVQVIARGCFELMTMPAETDAGGTQWTKPAQGAIAFDAVSVLYPKASVPALQELSFDVKPGQTLAIVGASGAGKSSIINALLGFVVPTSGRILLDGVPIEELTRKCLRQQFAVVSQEVVLFNGSVADNVVYALPRDDERLAASLRAAALEDLVRELPQGVNSMIGVNGSALSGGQRQRLSIARALYKDAPIWILDEATSALDSESERVIQQALQSSQGRKTMILIAHRLSTVAHADLILVLDRGRVVEMGSHAELVASQGHYARALALQSTAL